VFIPRAARGKTIFNQFITPSRTITSLCFLIKANYRTKFNSQIPKLAERAKERKVGQPTQHFLLLIIIGSGGSKINKQKPSEMDF
jgi:hypothetical protein